MKIHRTNAGSARSSRRRSNHCCASTGSTARRPSPSCWRRCGSDRPRHQWSPSSAARFSDHRARPEAAVTRSIPIANLYYLLCYAWRHVREADVVRREELAGLDGTHYLLGKVLAEGDVPPDPPGHRSWLSGAAGRSRRHPWKAVGRRDGETGVTRSWPGGLRVRGAFPRRASQPHPAFHPRRPVEAPGPRRRPSAPGDPDGVQEARRHPPRAAGTPAVPAGSARPQPPPSTAS